MWGSDGGKKKVHLINWETLCKLKKEGGLRLRQAEMMNMAFLAKLGWRAINEPNSLWSRLLRAKYGEG